jgi:hypothetical protein
MPPCIENPILPPYNTLIIHIIDFVASLLLGPQIMTDELILQKGQILIIQN